MWKQPVRHRRLGQRTSQKGLQQDHQPTGRTQLLTSLQQGKDGRWQGKLFIPDKNMRVTAKIQLVNDQQLKVSGCLAGKALCRADVWTRTTDPLPASN